MAASLGVATFSYAPCSIFCLASHLPAMTLSYSARRMQRLPEQPGDGATPTPAG